MSALAVVVSTIASRKSLFERSLKTWRASIVHAGIDAHVCIYAEGWNPQEIVREALGDIPFTIRTAHLSGSHIPGYNFFIKSQRAERYLFTHPEILFPAATVAQAAQVEPNEFMAFKAFWLPRWMTENLDRYEWQQPETLEQEEDLYTFDASEKGEFYANRGIRAIQSWEASTTWAIDHATLQRMKPPFPDFREWGPDVVFLVGLRVRLGIRDRTVQDPILFHQWHQPADHTKNPIPRALQALATHPS